MAAGLPLPDKVFAHGWLLVGGEKMSKSKLTGFLRRASPTTSAPTPSAITSCAPSSSGRTARSRGGHTPPGTRPNWPTAGQPRLPATAMVVRYRDGSLPAPGDYTNADLALQELLVACAEQADAAMGRLDFSGGILAIKEFVDAVNMYVTEQQPWVLAKDEATAQRLDTVLYTICESLRAIAVLYHPVMPAATRSCGTASEQPVSWVSSRCSR